jgi:hypothetical protein
MALAGLSCEPEGQRQPGEAKDYPPAKKSYTALVPVPRNLSNAGNDKENNYDFLQIMVLWFISLSLSKRGEYIDHYLDYSSSLL